MIKKWDTLSEETINENPWGGYYKNRFRTADGVEGDYYYHKNLNAVSAFVLKEDGTFVMLREYRYLFDKISLSQVMGGIEKGETPEQTALREIREEVGYMAKKITPIGTLATAPAFSKELIYIFLGEDLEKGEVKHEAREYTEPVVMSRDEIDKAIQSGEIWDSDTVSAWELTKAYLDKRANTR